MLKLAPSILAADFKILGEQISILEQSNVDYLHIDVMDGMYVPSISFGMPVITSIREASKLVFDVHLMIEEPERYIKEFKDAGADIITVHAEACRHLHSTIKQIKDMGIKVGVSLNPATPLHILEYVLKDIDMVLIMTVNPGFGGQEFIHSSYRKIKELRQMADTMGHYNLDIEVDGGINTDNVKDILKAGANVIVAGTSVFKGDIKENVKKFKDIFDSF